MQLAPLSLYNYVVFDMLQDLPSPEAYDPDDPPESIVMISLGTDATDLVVTNGFKVWQRSVPLGGNHFTKSLTKEMKLTFAKAEHLKRNATTRRTQQVVFQAMRPVFNDLQTELQRSLGFFTNLDRTAKIGKVVAMGNAFKLPGLRRYLAQSLGFEIERVDTFRGLVGAEVLATPAFKDNILSFGVCYGLCLQGLQNGGLRTNLLPKEISMDRLIRRKKPWAVAAAAVVMLACTVSYAAYALQFNAVKEPLWKDALDKATKVNSDSTRLKGEYADAVKKYKDAKDKGDRLVNNLQNRSKWLEFLTKLDKCLPVDSRPMPNSTDPEVLRKEIMHREQLLITNVDSQQADDVSKWFALVKPWYTSFPGQPGAPPLSDSSGAVAASGTAGAVAAAEGPTGPGIIVQIYGKHFHNARDQKEGGTQYVISTLLTKLASKEMRDLGVSYPVLVKPAPNDKEEIVIPGPKRSDNTASQGFGGGGGFGGGMKVPLGGPMPGIGAAGDDDKKVTVDRFQFRVQFVWQAKSAEEQIAGASGGTAAVTGPAGPAHAPSVVPGATSPATKR